MPKNKNFKHVTEDNPALAFLGVQTANTQNNTQDENSVQLAHDNMIEIDLLVPYTNHPFKLYEGDRLSDMVRSIKEMGVLLPIIVRPIGSDNKQYEILSGHNRVNAARAAGLNQIPAIIKHDLSDNEAALIVTETNLVQRSFADLSHSERAVALKQHLDALKNSNGGQGRRNDLLSEIEMLSNPDNTKTNSTSALLGEKLFSVEKVGMKYGLSKNSVARYVRISYLIEPLLERLNNDEIGLYPAVSLSYLSPDEQTELNAILTEKKYKVDMKKAEVLRDFSETKKLTPDRIIQILSGELNKKTKTKLPATFKIKYKLYTKYFDEAMKQDEVESIIDKALDAYFKNSK